MSDEKKSSRRSLWTLLFGPKVSDEEYDQLKDSTRPPPELGIGFSNSKWVIAAGLLMILLFFGVGGLYVYFSEISGAIIASGVVKAEFELQTVQHLEGGIVEKILVKEGEMVTEGQPLLVLQSSRISASGEQIRNKIHARQITAARLEAEKLLADEINWPQDLLDDNGEPLTADLKILVENEKKIFAANRQTIQGQVDLLNKEREQLRKEIDNLRDQRRSVEEIALSLKEELVAKKSLSDERYLDKSVVLDLQRRVAEIEGERERLKGSVAENLERIAEIQIKINGLYNSLVEQAVSELALIKSELLDLREQLRPMEDARKRLTVTAPIAGEIAALQIHSPGGVIKPGGKILDILPKNSPLIIECPIQVTDIAKIRKVKETKVQLTAFNARTLSKVAGEVTYISADTEEKQTNYGMQPAYKVHVSINEDDLQKKNMYVAAGMPATVFFITKPRTILNYVLEPFRQSFAKARGS